jgi:hypothetical protein
VQAALKTEKVSSKEVCVAEETPINKTAADAEKLYKLHVVMLMHGKALCSTVPNCSQCPLQPGCEFSSAYTAAGGQFATPAAPHLVRSESALLIDSDTWVKIGVAPAVRIHPGDPRPLVFCKDTDEQASPGKVRGRDFVSPWTAFKGCFPMNGTYFLENELFQVEGRFEIPACIAEKAQTESSSKIHIARSLEPIFSGITTDEMRNLCSHAFVCIRTFQPSNLSLSPMAVDPSLQGGDQDQQKVDNNLVGTRRLSEFIRSLKNLHSDIVRAAAIITGSTTGLTGTLRAGHKKAQVWLSNLNSLAERIHGMTVSAQAELLFGIEVIQHTHNSIQDVSRLLQKHCQKRWVADNFSTEDLRNAAWAEWCRVSLAMSERCSELSFFDFAVKWQVTSSDAYEYMATVRNGHARPDLSW